MFQFLHAADIHLDSPLRGLERYENAPVNELRNSTRQAFENLVDLAIEKEVAFVLLCGDIYDGDWQDYNTGLYFINQMHRLRKAGISVHLLSGNHDAESQITKYLKLPDNVTRYDHKKPQTVELNDLRVAIHGQSFPDRKIDKDLATGYPSGKPDIFNIGLLHTSFDGERPPHANYAPCTLGSLRSKGYQYWALGHVHTREEISCDPWVVFPGNIQGRHIQETGPKGCSLVSVEDGVVTSVDKYDLDVLRWAIIRVDISDIESADSTVDCVRRALDEALESSSGRFVAARLILEGTTKAHAGLTRNFDHWIEEYHSQASSFDSPGIWLEKIQLRTAPPVDRNKLFDRDDALGDLLRTISNLDTAPLDLARLSDEFSDLKNKLPPEVFAGDEVLDLTSPEALKGALPDIKDILLNRLFEEGGRK